MTTDTETEEAAAKILREPKASEEASLLAERREAKTTTCVNHADVLATQNCVGCKKALCDRCIPFDVDDTPMCEACGLLEDERSRSLGSALLAFVGVGYLATLAVGYLVFHARPFVGGLAAVVSIALGRALQLALKLHVVKRRT